MSNKRCQVFTPQEYVDALLDNVQYQGNKILRKLFLENSVGEGNIILAAVQRYITVAQKNGIKKDELKRQLETYFIAFEIDIDVLEKCKRNLDVIAEEFDLMDINWNILNENYLAYTKEINADYIVGNPPYITYKDLDISERLFLKNSFKSCEKGKFDYCYAFIEKSLKDLNASTGKMSYIIPSSIFKNTFGLNLRNILLPDISKILDFQHRTVFSRALISPAIIVVDKSDSNDYMVYKSPDKNHTLNIPRDVLSDKWIFSTNLPDLSSNKVFGDYFNVTNSVATLLNEAFIIKEYSQLEDHTVISGGIKLEKSVVRDAVSPRGKAFKREEKIIFPYKFGEQGELIRYSENEFINSFPNVVQYLNQFSDKLSKRKADGLWFEFGRSQALRLLNQEKILISSIITDSVKIYDLSKEAIPYSGFFITVKEGASLQSASEILKSEEMYQHLLDRAINASGRSIRISVKDIESFVMKE